VKKLIDFLDKLEDATIHYQLYKVRDAIMVEVRVPGQRWEVEFFADGSVEIEKFISENGSLYGEEELEVLFRDFSD